MNEHRGSAESRYGAHFGEERLLLESVFVPYWLLVHLGDRPKSRGWNISLLTFAGYEPANDENFVPYANSVFCHHLNCDKLMNTHQMCPIDRFGKDNWTDS